jgi:hypothetical protein
MSNANSGAAQSLKATSLGKVLLNSALTTDFLQKTYLTGNPGSTYHEIDFN